MESLKDMEIRHPQQQPPPSVSTLSAKPSENGVFLEELSKSLDTKQASSSIVDHDKHSNTRPISSIVEEVSKPANGESKSNSVIQKEN